jgi:hypothetical protein
MSDEGGLVADFVQCVMAVVKANQGRDGVVKVAD